MPLDTSASSIALGQLSALPFGNIIGGPLNAAIEAQAKAAQTTVDFIQSVGFDESLNGQLSARTLEFTFEDGAGIFRRVTVPLLSVIPIPFIVIDAVDIQFKARIAASASQKTEVKKQNSFSGSARGRFRFWGQRLDISAGYSSKKDSKASQESKYSVEYTMDVHVHASQAGIPQGMAEVLNILQDGISNTPNESRITVISLPNIITLAAGVDDIGDNDNEFRLLILDASGEPIVGEGASVTVTPVNGGLDAIEPVNPNTSGIVPLTLVKGQEFPEASGAQLTETLEILVTIGTDENTETTTLTRNITLRRS